MDCEVYEQAIQYFERAALIQPNDVKWYLMAASCHRRSGNYQQALEMYKRIHARFPDNVDCLRFLVRICTDLGMKELHDYVGKLRKAEKAKEMAERAAREAARNKGNGGDGDDDDDDDDGDQLGHSGGSSGRRDRSRDRDSGSRRGSKQQYDLSDPYNDSPNHTKDVDATYEDPLGELPARPKTGSTRRHGGGGGGEEVSFANEELGDDMLPE